jgi:hypothetical protein
MRVTGRGKGIIRGAQEMVFATTFEVVPLIIQEGEENEKTEAYRYPGIPTAAAASSSSYTVNLGEISRCVLFSASPFSLAHLYLNMNPSATVRTSSLVQRTIIRQENWTISFQNPRNPNPMPSRLSEERKVQFLSQVIPSHLITSATDSLGSEILVMGQAL